MKQPNETAPKNKPKGGAGNSPRKVNGRNHRVAYLECGGMGEGG